MLCRALAVLAIAAASLSAQGPFPAADSPDWHRAFAAFKIIGNVYYVGTYDLACYLITTPQGHILINTGSTDSAPMIRASIQSLGFRPEDIKILTATHAHVDHTGAMAELKKLTNARLYMEEGDVGMLESGGKIDYRFPEGRTQMYEPAKVDQILKDGDKITFGGVELTAHHHPGHTLGSTSFTFNVTDGGKTYRVGIVNMGSINPGVKVSGMPGFPGITQAYARTFHDQSEMQIDIWLASHAGQFKMHDKYKPGDAYDPNRFVDPQGFKAEVARLEKIYREHLAQEQAAK